MPTLYFSYSLPGGSLDIDEPLSSPYSISYHVGRFLRHKAASIGYDFQYRNLDDTSPVTFDPQDVAIGHTWWDGGFMHHALNASIKGKLILQPYSAGMVSPNDTGMVLDLFSKADEILAVTGEYWHSTIDSTPYAVLADKVTRIDMAVSCDAHPHLKTTWNKKGQRAICVIGHDTPTKGYKNVAELARVAGIRLGHFGSAHPETFEHVPCMVMHGGMIFTPDAIAAVCSQYDAVLAMPLADANPTVLLEAAAWGLKVYCTYNAGYLPYRPFEELKPDNLAFNVSQMRALQQMDEYELTRDSLALRQIIEKEYTFEKMCSTIWQKVSQYL